MKSKITFSFAVALLSFSSVLFAQDAKSTASTQTAEVKKPGDPIPGVGVNLGRKQGGESVKTIFTDANGNFEFTNLTPGKYSLKIIGVTAEAAAVQSHEIKSPRDAASGLATGKRMREVNSQNETSTDDAEKNTRAGVSTSRSNIRTKQMVAAEVLVEGDPDTPPTQDNTKSKTTEATFQLNLFDTTANNGQKTVNTSRANIKSQRVMKIEETVDVEVGADGRIVGNVLKTKHDTVKNSINNVR